MLSRVVLVLIFWCLGGCAVFSPSLIPIDDAPTHDLSLVAALRQDLDTLLLRGVDRMPAPLPFPIEAVYLIKPGRHMLWAKMVPGLMVPLPIPQKIRCYVIEAELLAGVLYYLEEDAGGKSARLLREDPRQVVASGPLVDEPWIFASDCRWP